MRTPPLPSPDHHGQRSARQRHAVRPCRPYLGRLAVHAVAAAAVQCRGAAVRAREGEGRGGGWVGRGTGGQGGREPGGRAAHRHGLVCSRHLGKRCPPFRAIPSFAVLPASVPSLDLASPSLLLLLPLQHPRAVPAHRAPWRRGAHRPAHRHPWGGLWWAGLRWAVALVDAVALRSYLEGDADLSCMAGPSHVPAPFRPPPYQARCHTASTPPCCASCPRVGGAVV